MENPLCLNCGQSEMEKPLLIMKFQGGEIYICPQCLPALIHRPASLAEKISGAEKFGPPVEHHH